jgi:hypothetical protein
MERVVDLELEELSSCYFINKSIKFSEFFFPNLKTEDNKVYLSGLSVHISLTGRIIKLLHIVQS